MDKEDKRQNNINKLQILIGILVLLIGTLVYLVDRPPDQTYFVSKSLPDISLYGVFPNLFGAIGSSLPTFSHVFAFIMITAGFVSCGKRGAVVICIFWFVVDCAFELAQKFYTWPVKMTPDWFNGIPYLENTKNYFIHGTFHILDVATIAMGSILAFFVLLLTNKKNSIHKK